MNKVILIGRLTRDPEVRYTQGTNMAIARYTLAVDRRRSRSQNGDQQEQTADFISIVAFDKRAEFAEKYLKKGSKIGVVGHIQTGSYTNKDGQKVYTTEVIVDEHEFVDSKASSQGNGDYSGGYSNSGYQGGGSYQSSSAPAPSREQPSGTVDGFMNIPDGIDEELPFQ